MLPLFPIVLLALQTVEMPSVQTDFLYDVQMVDVIFTWSMAAVAGLFLFAVLYFQRLYFKKHPELLDNA